MIELRPDDAPLDARIGLVRADAEALVCDLATRRVWAATPGAAGLLGHRVAPDSDAFDDWFTGPWAEACTTAIGAAMRGDPWPVAVSRRARSVAIEARPTAAGTVIVARRRAGDADVRVALSAIERISRTLRAAPAADDVARLAADALGRLTGFDTVWVFGPDGRPLARFGDVAPTAGGDPAASLDDAIAAVLRAAADTPLFCPDVQAAPRPLHPVGPAGHDATSVGAHQPGGDAQMAAKNARRAAREANVAPLDASLRGRLAATGAVAWGAVPFRPAALPGVGGVAFAHPAPLDVDPVTRIAARLVVDALQWRLEELTRTDRVQRERRALALTHALIGEARTRTLTEALARHADDALALVRCDALALVTPARVTVFGAGPPRALVRGLALFGSAQADDGAWFTDAVPLDDRLPAVDRRATGVAVVPLGHDGRSALVAMRHGTATAVDGTRRAPAWSAADRMAATSLAEACAAVLERAAAADASAGEAGRRDQLERFADVVAHELHQPLYEIEMLASLLAGSDPAQPDAHAELTAATRQAARRLRHTTVQLADYARVAGRSMARRPCDLGELARDARDAVADVLGDGAMVRIGTLPPALGDRPQLRRVFVQLFSNAARFASPDRPLRVVVRGRALDGGGACIEVEDNGVGIPPRDLARVFLPFVRAASPSVAGSGLGLAIVERIVDRHGGAIEATRAVPHGTCVRFSLDGALP